MQNNAVEYKFIFNLSATCSSCNFQFPAMLKKIKENFSADQYHIIVITDSDTYGRMNVDKYIEKQIFRVKKDDNLYPKLGFNKKELTNTMIIQKGKTLIFDDIAVPDYFIEIKEILN